MTIDVNREYDEASSPAGDDCRRDMTALPAHVATILDTSAHFGAAGRYGSTDKERGRS